MKTKNVAIRCILSLLLMTVIHTIGNAQEKGDWGLGGNLVYGNENAIKNYGIALKAQYNVSNPVRLEANFMNFFKKNYVRIWSLSTIFHYLFPLNESTTIYPLGGVGYLEAVRDATYYSYKKHGSDAAIYLGGGIDYMLTPSVVGNVELKYEGAKDWNRLLLSLGIAYRF